MQYFFLELNRTSMQSQPTDHIQTGSDSHPETVSSTDNMGRNLLGHGITIALMNLQQLWAPVHDLHKVKAGQHYNIDGKVLSNSPLIEKLLPADGCRGTCEGDRQNEQRTDVP